jgi:C_GCAxxG_C_C family probable redox protein
MTNVERVLDLFRGDLNCSQAILTVFGEPFGMDRETARRLGRPFGAGMGRMAGTCGALTGAMMVLGLARDQADEKEAKNDVYRYVRELVKRFEERHTTSVCRELLGADLSTEKGMEKARKEKLVARLCPTYVKDAAKILETMLSR